MFRKPLFWIVFFLVSAGCVGFTLKLFPRAFPLVTLDLHMDRQTALDVAGELARRYDWEPDSFRQAASFRLDRRTQNFVELEGGGTVAFAAMLRDDLYSPYTWRVRHFKEGDPNETLIRFTPEGEVYGFVETLSEETPGASLTSDSALAIAVGTAEIDWGIDLSGYERVEESQETTPGGRTDHTFVWERRDVQIGEGKYRLRLVTGGERLTELTHFVKIPEGFSRRHQEMRSANNTIAAVSIIAVGLLYIFGGCIVGVFLLLRQRWVVWRQPIIWGFSIAFLQVLAGINQWPLTWMGYDTALSTSRFMLTQIVILIVTFISLGVIISLALMAAESLSRKAFPHHIQQWRLWSGGVANSHAVLGRTVGGYLLISVFWAYEVSLYFFSSKVLGWWTPSEALFQPDVLATYFPWLSSIAISAQAGIFEESLFRAVPIAGAALLGTRFGQRNVWIAGAFVLQAVIFGAAHASYSTQPAYARLVELILPSLGFGFIYLFFGLLPAIVLHFGVDLVSFAMPLFVSTAPGTWLSQLVIVLVGFSPLILVLVARLRAKSWTELSESDFNKGWKAPEKETAERKHVEMRMQTAEPAVRRLVPVAGITGLILWLAFTSFDADSPPLQVSRDDAEELALESLSANGTDFPGARILAGIDGRIDQEDRFVWQTGGKELYGELIGEFLEPPHWRIRLVKFDGDVAERAEEFRVYVAGNGLVFRVRHQLPEAREGESLSEEEARIVARSAVEELYEGYPPQLEEISAVESKHPNRRDWLFTFADTVSYPLGNGEARIAVEISGDEITDVKKFVHVPQEWARDERSRMNMSGILSLFCTIILIIALVSGIVGAVVRWSRKNLSARVFVSFGTLFMAIGVVSLANGWPATVARFSTAEPVSNQTFTAIAFPLLGIFFLSVGAALLVGLIHNWKQDESHLGYGQAIVLGVSLGLLAGGISSLMANIAPSTEPGWGEYASLGSYLPLLSSGLRPMGQYITTTIVLLIIFVTMDRFTVGWTERKGAASVSLVIMGIILTGAASVETVWFWLLSGLVVGTILLFAYRVLLRVHLSLVPIAVGTMAILGAVKEGNSQAHPAAAAGVVLAAVLIALLSMFWYRSLQRGGR